jgi:hypothetical protein
MITDKRIKEIILEATTTNGSRGSYIGPLQQGVRKFKKSEIEPFDNPVSKYDSPYLEYDSYDGKMETPKKQIKKLEKIASKSTNYLKNHPETTFSDEDGNIINRTPSGRTKGKKLEIVPIEHKKTKTKINEVNSSTTAGEYNGPQELGLKKWTKSELGPYQEESNIITNEKAKRKNTKKNVYRTVGMWEPRKKSLDVPTYDVEGEKQKKIKKNLINKPFEYVNFFKKVDLNEDLAVWFGKKKKPKGSSQPKGPWVDICRKVDGKHPPCGRKDADTGSYPKCRATGVAGKMSDSQKRAACQQKRNAEKNDTQSGKGQKPIMTSYKTKKESFESLVNNILFEFRNSF